MKTGENIKKRRIQLNMSQQDLADALGYKTRSSIAKLEKNNSNLSQDKLLILARVLNTTVDYLLTGECLDGESAKGDLLDSYKIQELEDNPKQKYKCAAIILAGGKNRVNKYQVPFQFVTVKEKPIIFYTLETFQRHPAVDEIYIVCLEGWEDFLPAYADKYGISKLKDIIPSGQSGIQSVKHAVDWLAPFYHNRDILLFQEATRPFVEPEIISNAIRCCKQFGNAVTYERMDGMTPFLLNKNSGGLQHLDAYSLINVQSPEVYTLGFLRYAFMEAGKIRHPLDETICAVFLHNMGRELKFCEGGHNNIRIVSDDDLRILEALI